MSTAVQEPETVTDEAATPAPAAPTAEAERSRDDLFEYSRWIHLGDGALDCAEARTGKCQTTGHFHAWIRLPNPLQIRDIAEKAKAAQARRRRMLKDDQTDAWVILEDGMDELRDESMRDLMVEDLLGERFHEVYQDAVREVLNREEDNAEPDEDTGEVPKLYEHIGQDQEEYDRLAQLPEEERDADEFNALERRIANYSRDVDDEIKRLQEPRREGLKEKSTDELVDLIRQKRIASEGADSYINTFNTWQMYVCTFKPREKGVPRERYFADINSLKHDQPSSVVQALQQNFRDLEIKLARNRGLGNS